MNTVNEWLNSTRNFQKYLANSTPKSRDIISGISVDELISLEGIDEEELTSKDIEKLMQRSKRIEGLLIKHKELYGRNDKVVIVSSPGRAELIGNFQDNYEGGHTLSAAIAKDVLGVASKHDSMLQVYSFQQPNDLFEIELDKLLSLKSSSRGKWYAIPEGIISLIKTAYSEFTGVKMVLDSHVTIGSGCSSSAAFENYITFSLNQLFNLQIPMLEMAKISKKAENDFFGKECGYLDQITSLVGGIVHIKYEDLTRFNLLNTTWFNGWDLITVMADKDHSGNPEDYNSIKHDLEVIADEIQKENLKGNLDGFIEVYGNKRNDFQRGSRQARGLFYIEEYLRVNEAILALRKGYANRFGELIKESGEGSRHLLGNTTKRIDEAVDFAHEIPNTYARVHGGGFGGSILLFTSHQHTKDIMVEKYGKENVHVHGIRPGVSEIKLYD